MTPYVNSKDFVTVNMFSLDVFHCVKACISGCFLLAVQNLKNPINKRSVLDIL